MKNTNIKRNCLFLNKYSFKDIFARAFSKPETLNMVTNIPRYFFPKEAENKTPQYGSMETRMQQLLLRQ